MKESDKMGIAGIVAEFNPFHYGHKYIIDCANGDGHTVAAVISGNFVQRGDISIISKFDRTRQALLNGVDIVLELPVPWAMSTAQNFALGALSQLKAVGIDTLYFGSECGDAEMLLRASDIINSDAFSSKQRERMQSGKTFAAIRQEILSEEYPELSTLLSGANDTLAIEYISAAHALNMNVTFNAVKRVGAQHNDDKEQSGYSTATLLREKAYKGDIDYLKKFMPDSAFKVFNETEISDLKYIERAILSALRSLGLEEIKRLPDISEGIENRFFAAIKQAATLEELYCLIKSKRYTLARIRRLVLSAFLGIDSSFFKTEPPYVRILGFKGDAIRKINPSETKPIITRVSKIEKLGKNATRIFELEAKATDLYSICFENPKKCGAEYTTPIVKI